ncbi:hypothetical protein OAU50_04260 [Planctomycetota bacterium]|nr:hypothetical protein [Planctomycetota bacterium]
MLTYIDPGSGMILLQTVIAAVLGIAIFFRDKAMMVFRAIFGRKANPVSKDEDGTAEQPTEE